MIIDEVTDPVEDARRRAREEQARRELDWLAAHWPDILPQAYGNTWPWWENNSLSPIRQSKP